MTTDHQQNGTWRSGQGQYAQPGVVMQPLVSQPNGEIIHEQKWGQLYAHQDEHLPHEEHHMPTITYQDAPVIQMQEDTSSPDPQLEAAVEPSPGEQQANLQPDFQQEKQTTLTPVFGLEISQES
ncbi:unnamed protein product [Oikopleura dioica]|uniref:Uncharacterized protein n=1 Tax=Oikopleura dioica TaxID=34765 RepID=E4XVG7_OIKDI|nr:unnamed protein product [Oikopleura dioica]